MSGLSRRTVLEAASLAGCAGIAGDRHGWVAAPTATGSAAPGISASHDAVLIALCAEQAATYRDAEILIGAACDRYGCALPVSAEAEINQCLDRQRALEASIASRPAVTPSGRAAKANAVRLRLGCAAVPPPDTRDGLIWSLTEDVLRGGWS
ncbi:hypothetical protein NFI95_15855 [Acetobacteraceae bacterium KSS8]|uniref:Twin-arginine translocation signal domain-containing protein n=1 Tax=Endosaccharibacter trunci TaxID=2812733 RepID=A0ABT1WCC2_9PROT|nr:hypothetical protein [Acetobacteraceae bacterium KSS8]